MSHWGTGNVIQSPWLPGTGTDKNGGSTGATGADGLLIGTYTVSAKTSYAVTYNANGGSGAPSSQTKWYNENLTLSATTPTRTGYKFLGWATSSTATSASYQPSASYTSNAALSLYAVWKPLVYVKVSGAWKPAKPYVKVSGAWKEVKSAYVKVSGVWKQLF